HRHAAHPPGRGEDLLERDVLDALPHPLPLELLLRLFGAPCDEGQAEEKRNGDAKSQHDATTPEGLRTLSQRLRRGQNRDLGAIDAPSVLPGTSARPCPSPSPSTSSPPSSPFSRRKKSWSAKACAASSANGTCLA